MDQIQESPGRRMRSGPETARGRHLLDYWKTAAGKRPWPRRVDIEPGDITSLLPNILMLDVSHDPLDFQYRLIGTAITERSERDYTGERVRDLPMQKPPSLIWTLYETAALQKKPACAHVPYRDEQIRYVEMLALPISCDGQGINMLIGSVVFDRGMSLTSDLQAI